MQPERPDSPAQLVPLEIAAVRDWWDCVEVLEQPVPQVHPGQKVQVVFLARLELLDLLVTQDLLVAEEVMEVLEQLEQLEVLEQLVPLVSRVLEAQRVW